MSVNGLILISLVLWLGGLQSLDVANLMPGPCCLDTLFRRLYKLVHTLWRRRLRHRIFYITIHPFVKRFLLLLGLNILLKLCMSLSNFLNLRRLHKLVEIFRLHTPSHMIINVWFIIYVNSFDLLTYFQLVFIVLHFFLSFLLEENFSELWLNSIWMLLTLFSKGFIKLNILLLKLLV